MMQHCTSGTKYSISGYDSRWFEQIWCILEVLIFSPLTYNGEVTKLTWPQVNNITNPKYTNCRHLCTYCTMRVSKSSDHWCALGTMSNFEKRNLRSDHLIRPGHVTFGVSGSSFFGNVSNCWLNSYGKFLAICAVFSLSAKNLTGGWNQPPPPVRGLTLASLGGGGAKGTMCFFANSSWSTGHFALKLVTPLRATIPHIESKD